MRNEVSVECSERTSQLYYVPILLFAQEDCFEDPFGDAVHIFHQTMKRCPYGRSYRACKRVIVNASRSDDRTCFRNRFCRKRELDISTCVYLVDVVQFKFNRRITRSVKPCRCGVNTFKRMTVNLYGCPSVLISLDLHLMQSHHSLNTPFALSSGRLNHDSSDCISCSA